MPSFMKQIAVTHRCAILYRDRALQDIGIGGHQTPYLTCLYRHPDGITQDEMARELDVNKSSVTRQLALLEEKGLVLRKTDQRDRRITMVYPTEIALSYKDRIYDLLHQWSRFLMEDFTEEEQALMSAMMKRVADKAESYVRGESGCELSGDI